MTRRLATALGVGILAAWAAAPALSLLPAGAASSNGLDQSWVKWDAAAKTAHLTIMAASNNSNSGFNFNGYSSGQWTITVPVGAKVQVSFINKASLAHSIEVTPYDKRMLPGNFPLAFSGASVPNPGTGAAKMSKPQTFTFTADKAGMYALVCGVPGHAVAGMWDVLKVAKVAAATQSAGGATTTSATPTPAPTSNGGSMGTVEGVVTDATSGRPIGHAYVIVGWTTLMRVGETDAYGHYRIDNVKPVALTDSYGFAQGYVYYHGHPIPIKAGQTTTYSFKMPRQTFPDNQLPHVSGATITPNKAKEGGKVAFQLHARPGKGGKMSAEVFAVNGAFGQSVLLRHVGNDVYRGTWQVPSGVAPGAYQFFFFGAMENCLENQPYP
ncbi:MAG: carboxypeptidase regulatory-like domain-containing protein, partial [Chloroflexota bacterium]